MKSTNANHESGSRPVTCNRFIAVEGRSLAGTHWARVPGGLGGTIEVDGDRLNARARLSGLPEDSMAQAKRVRPLTARL